MNLRNHLTNQSVPAVEMLYGSPVIYQLPEKCTFVYLCKNQNMASRIVEELIKPQSIVIVGGSNNIQKPGGKLIKNITTGTYQGKIYAVNPKEKIVQGVRSYSSVKEIPDTDLAILAIPARFCTEAVRILTREKNTRAFIIVSAGFSEESEEGRKIENEVATIIDDAGGTLIGPNCIGVMTPYYQGVFTLPIPQLSPDGCDLISGSGATAVFIMESGIPKGLRFSSVFSVGNSAQCGVEEIMEYLDESFDPEVSSKNKILYIESIKKPYKLLKHSVSLIKKGCRIAAIKAGTSEAGSRAASSHTGAMASSDHAVSALFRKAGIVRCYSREELSTVAGLFSTPEIGGKNVAIITHAGGPAVMLTDELSRAGFKIPPLSGPEADLLQEQLFPGSSVANPIDILATGTADQVGKCIDFCERHPDIDLIIIIFGSSGLSKVFDVYELIDRKMKGCRKPVIPVMPSVKTAFEEIRLFREKGHIIYTDEVELAKAIGKISYTPPPAEEISPASRQGTEHLRKVLQGEESGYLQEETLYRLLDFANIPVVATRFVRKEDELKKIARELSFPVVMKIVGPVHKSDLGGVILDIDSEEELYSSFKNLQQIKDYQGAVLQPMINGLELFLGANYEENFGHVIYCGLGGIFVEALQDVSSGLVPLSKVEALDMIRSLRSYKVLEGMRGKQGIDTGAFADIIVKLSDLLSSFPEIKELDLNPLIGSGKNITAVDARIRI